jgi:hypothetical protein
VNAHKVYRIGKDVLEAGVCGRQRLAARRYGGWKVLLCYWAASPSRLSKCSDGGDEIPLVVHRDVTLGHACHSGRGLRARQPSQVDADVRLDDRR